MLSALFLGMSFGAAGLLAKQINSGIAGYKISSPAWHNYLTMLGRLSGFILPIIAIVIAAASSGLTGGIVTFGLLALGSIIIDLLNPSYQVKTLIALIGLPLSILLFVLSI